MSERMGVLAGALGLLGLFGLAGLAAVRQPCAPGRAGARVRALGLLGLGGIAGFWIDGAGAMGAAGALSLWNHQNLRLARWAWPGWSFLAGAAVVLARLPELAQG
ncbi:MAG TPA: hypothetical protein VFF98_17875 [Novosphingobium sp.]|nr:hypothetical protein [Novosphingobium sp.]